MNGVFGGRKKKGKIVNNGCRIDLFVRKGLNDVDIIVELKNRGRKEEKARCYKTECQLST